MIDQVLEGQHKLMVNVNGKIDAVYTELNAKFETLNTHYGNRNSHCLFKLGKFGKP